MNIVVLAGGNSLEREVSLSTGTMICNALNKIGHNVLLLDAFYGMEEDVVDLKELFGKYKLLDYNLSEEIPDIDKLKKNRKNNNDFLGKNVLELCQYADCVFMALHGGVGENGKLQSLFDLYNIKYTGTGAKGSMLAMDKELSKKIVRTKNIKVPDAIIIHKQEELPDGFCHMSYPMIVKPMSGGSSIGVKKVENKMELNEAIIEAFLCDKEVMIEEYIDGREFSVGVLDGKVLPAIEILPINGFYDYKHKYIKGMTKEICPAHLKEEEKKILEKITLTIHNELKLGNYSRIDYIQNKSGDFFFLEANTIPGMTPTSLLPQEARAVGITFEQLCEKIVQSAHVNLD